MLLKQSDKNRLAKTKSNTNGRFKNHPKNLTESQAKAIRLANRIKPKSV